MGLAAADWWVGLAVCAGMLVHSLGGFLLLGSACGVNFGI